VSNGVAQEDPFIISAKTASPSDEAKVIWEGSLRTAIEIEEVSLILGHMTCAMLTFAEKEFMLRTTKRTTPHVVDREKLSIAKSTPSTRTEPRRFTPDNTDKL
jgi:carbonic anhydrase